MGKIKTYILELSELYSDMLWFAHDIDAAKRLMREELTDDEYEFFEENYEIIVELAFDIER